MKSAFFEPEIGIGYGHKLAVHRIMDQRHFSGVEVVLGHFFESRAHIGHDADVNRRIPAGIRRVVFVKAILAPWRRKHRIAHDLDIVDPQRTPSARRIRPSNTDAVMCGRSASVSGTFGTLAAVSFHETKNTVSGEGGVLLVIDPALSARAEVIWEKGTNRRSFFRGEVGSFEWVDIGSSFAPSEILSAILSVQLARSHDIVSDRCARWRRYHTSLNELERRERLRRPSVPTHCEHNGHIYFILLPNAARRDLVIEKLGQHGIRALAHYPPLHSAPAGRKYGRVSGELARTTDLAARMLRLPLYFGMSDAEQDRVLDALYSALA